MLSKFTTSVSNKRALTLHRSFEIVEEITNYDNNLTVVLYFHCKLVGVVYISSARLVSLFTSFRLGRKTIGILDTFCMFSLVVNPGLSCYASVYL